MSTRFSLFLMSRTSGAVRPFPLPSLHGSQVHINFIFGFEDLLENDIKY
jgi:hypothetical protein